MRGIALAFIAVLTLAGCSRHPPPPSGFWEGTYDTPSAMVAARVEIDSAGNVRIMAPNAEEIGDNAEDRATMRQNLSAGLAVGWDRVDPRPMDFDGEIFRRPGGVAPQLLWDEKQRQMTMVAYLGKGHPIRFPLHRVKAFSDNPWPQQ